MIALFVRFALRVRVFFPPERLDDHGRDRHERSQAVDFRISGHLVAFLPGPIGTVT